MRFNTVFKYNRFIKSKTEFLRRKEGRFYNGPWEVTDTPEHLKGVITGKEDVNLIDYLVYRPLPAQIRKLGVLPQVHPQSYEMQIYYRKINKALTEGVYVGKEYFNPFFMMWLTLFIFEIPLYDKKGNMLEGSEIGKPIYCNIDRYIFDIMWKAYKMRKYVAFMSGRGIGKSFITDCIQAWYYILFNNQEIITSATSEPIVEEAWSKFRDTIDFIEKNFPGYKQKRILNSTKHILAGEIYIDANGDEQTRGSENSVRRILYGDNPDSTRGRRPHFQHIEEFAAFPAHPAKGCLKHILGHSKGSWIIMGSFKKAFVIMTGTGGSVANKDAEDVFTNPEASNLLEVNEWGKTTSLFIPSQLKYGGTWEVWGVPDIAKALKLIKEKRKSLESDPVLYVQELQEFPIELDEVFTIRGMNIFNQDKIAEMLAKLMIMKKRPWKRGKLEYDMNNQGEVLGVIFKEDPAGKIIIIEEPEIVQGETVPYNNLYVMGCDSIDQGVKDSLVAGSKLAGAVKKRMSNNMFSSISNLYVAFYNERSDDVRWDYENILKLAMYYNAKVNIEYTKINIVSFFREKGHFWRLLKRPSIAIGANVSGKKASQLIGTPATSAVIGHQDQKLADYIDDYYYQILYPPVLEQMRDYDASNRTPSDFVVACGLAELADEDMLGKPATEGGSASDDIKDFGFYRDHRGRKRWGVPPEKSKEIKSILEEEYEDAEKIDLGTFKWVDPSSSY